MVQVSCFVLSQQKCLQVSISQHLSKKEKLLLLKKSKNEFFQQKANELKEVAIILLSVIVLFSVCVKVKKKEVLVSCGSMVPKPRERPFTVPAAPDGDQDLLKQEDEGRALPAVL